MVPNSWLWRSARGDFLASSPARLGRPLVIVGIPNHMNAITSTPPISHQRIDGTLNQAQSMNTPTNGKNSGRPIAANTPKPRVQRYLPSRNMQSAARPNATSHGQVG